MTDTGKVDLVRKKREARRDWYGFLAVDNIDHVRDRIVRMLKGRRYTWVAINADLRHSSPEVRTGEHFHPCDSSKGKDGWATTHKVLPDGRPWAHVTFCDSYGVWGIDTTFATEQDAYAAAGEGSTSVTYVMVSGDGSGRRDRVEIQQYNGPGEKLIWTIVPEPLPERDLVRAWYAVDAGLAWHGTEHPAVVHDADKAMRAVSALWPDVTQPG